MGGEAVHFWLHNHEFFSSTGESFDISNALCCNPKVSLYTANAVPRVATAIMLPIFSDTLHELHATPHSALWPLTSVICSPRNGDQRHTTNDTNQSTIDWLQ